MPRAPLLPSSLMRRPFTAAQALMLGVTEDRLRGASWMRVARGVYAWREIGHQPLIRIQGALHRLPDGGVFSWSTAAWLQGLDLDPCNPIEATVLTGSGVTRRAGLKIHRTATIERSIARGLPVTSPLQTVVDLATGSELLGAVTILDMALHRRLVSQAALTRWIDAHPGQRGTARLHEVLKLAEPATESPMETRLRLALVLAGLPKPSVQPTLRSESGTFLARPDLYYPRHRLVIEYDGATHKDSIAADNPRQNRLLESSYKVLRFTASDVLGNPAAVVELVRHAIARAT